LWADNKNAYCHIYSLWKKQSQSKDEWKEMLVVPITVQLDFSIGKQLEAQAD
jgi:hypothetical protein